MQLKKLQFKTLNPNFLSCIHFKPGVIVYLAAAQTVIRIPNLDGTQLMTILCVNNKMNFLMTNLF